MTINQETVTALLLPILDQSISLKDKVIKLIAFTLFLLWFRCGEYELREQQRGAARLFRRRLRAARCSSRRHHTRECLIVHLKNTKI